MLDSKDPIGIFDSGVGGLSVLQAIQKELPGEALIYIADQAHVPYGPRPLSEVRRFSIAITKYLLSQGCKLIVLACNTASAAALHHLRETFPQTLFVGMEPAVKPAAETTNSKIVGVLATPATFQGELYASVVERFAAGVKIHQHTCPGLVAQIETGAISGSPTRRILEDALLPMLQKGVDTIVLGCTHYPFVIPMIEDIIGPTVKVIDPAPAVARQVKRQLDLHNLRNNSPSKINSKSQLSTSVRFLTTGDPLQFERAIQNLLNQQKPVEPIFWVQNEHITT